MSEMTTAKFRGFCLQLTTMTEMTKVETKSEQIKYASQCIGSLPRTFNGTDINEVVSQSLYDGNYVT